MKLSVFFSLALTLMLAAHSYIDTSVTIVSNEELASSVGATVINDSVLKTQTCADDTASSSGNQCALELETIYVNGVEMDIWVYRGNCYEACVGDGIRKWCASQCNMNCDPADQQTCGGELFKAPGCNLTSGCTYSAAGGC